ncbi:MAG: hypothetical protein P9M15_05975 [Candidatus Electryoneaceae bacterium]|nr:hypothetical protein [Candidatus Electryoneaceae bacterium]
MDKLLVVTWEVDRLVLRELAPHGIWKDDMPISATVDLERPTRFSKLNNSTSKKSLQDGLVELFKDVVVSQTKQPMYSVWLMLPKRWVQHFNIDNPFFHSDELQESHLLWETDQRLHEDIADYRLLLPRSYSDKVLNVSAVNENILQIIIDAMRHADVRLTGVCVEASNDEHYKIDRAENFIRATSVESPPVVESIFYGKKIWLMASAIVVVIVGVILIWMCKESLTLMFAQADSTTSTMTTSTLDSSEDQSEVDSTISLLRKFVQTFSHSTRLKLATLSPADFKAEISGLNDPETWLTELQQKSIFRSLQLEGGYPRNGVNTVLVRMKNTGWMTYSDSDGLARWEQRASSAGLTAEGYIAHGSFDSVLSFVDSMWVKPDGVMKIFVAPEKTGDAESDQWIIRVQ